MLPVRTVLPTLAGLALLLGTSPAQTNLEGQPFPKQALSRAVQGENIPVALGARLPQVAAWYGQTEAELRETCCRDKALKMSPQGHLFYACPAHVAGTPNRPRLAPARAFPASQTFLLHSLPGSQRTIYLDFNGHTTSGTDWNKYFTKGNSFSTPAYDTDGDATRFSDTELAAIQLIWQLVAEDFAPFHVNVTTQDPGIEALRKRGSSDSIFGVRVCIGGSSMDWFGDGAGGVALLNSFAWDSDTPAYVFSAELGGDPKHAADAASHEAGHTLNLNHDGQGAEEYYRGHGNWAPIMGVGYDRDVVQWSRGEYASATNKQDDIALIARHCPLLPDRQGDEIITARTLTGTSLSTSGLIETRSDADLFRFIAGAGPISLSATPATAGPNLDIVLALYNGVGNLVTTVRGSGMGATLSGTVPQGTYYLAIDGEGSGTPSTGYSDYGSLGQYSLNGLVVAPTTQPPVARPESSSRLTGLHPLSVRFSGVRSSDPDGTIASYDWDFGTGNGSSEASPAFTYTVPGTYIASLVVTDNAGVSSVPGIIRVVVLNQPQVFVAEIALKSTLTTRGVQATASVTLKDLDGVVKPGAMVSGRWSGLVKGTGSQTSNSSGVSTLLRPRPLGTERSPLP